MQNRKQRGLSFLWRFFLFLRSDVVYPEEAVIIAAEFCYLLGEVKHLDEIEQILEENARYKIITPCGLQWVKYLNQHLNIQG